jgi:hypothetical protein
VTPGRANTLPRILDADLHHVFDLTGAGGLLSHVRDVESNAVCWLVGVDSLQSSRSTFEAEQAARHLLGASDESGEYPVRAVDAFSGH